MKQHHQRILRLWRCPECDRTVRLPGRVTSRTCRCRGEVTMMQLQETDRIRKFDIDSFVSYQSEEDITPTAAELVDEIPRHLMPIGPTEEEIAAKAAKPRRGKAYLRTEIDEKAEADAKADAAKSESAGDDFGIGIENELPSTTDSSDENGSATGGKSVAADSDNDSETTADGTGRKRKRRRRRRGRSAGRRDGEENGETKSASDAEVASVVTTASNMKQDHAISKTINDTAQDEANPSVDGASETGAPTAGKKRRRRRRRRGKGGAPNAEASATDGGSTDGGSATNRDANSADVVAGSSSNDGVDSA